MKNATRDQIVQAIRVLWERDWLVSADTIQSQLLKGQHVKASLIECRDTYLAIQDTRDAWMAQFDPAVLAERRKLFDQKKP